MKFFFSSYTFAAFAVITAIASPAPHGASDINVIPSHTVTNPISAKYLSSVTGLDGPQLSAINSTSFDWWYFDIISPDLKTSLSVVFYNALPSAFPFLNPSDVVTVVGIYTSFPNGTLDTRYLNASEAIITTVKGGSTGIFQGSGAAWYGTADLSTYRVTINSPENGIAGSFKLKSRAPAHYPCGPAGPGVNMLVGPHIGWSNAVPDAVGVVDFKIGGSKLAFTGVGYHDKNWGDQAFTDNVGSWYWGHGRLGEYSIVWFDFLDINGVEHTSAYVSKNGKILTANCNLGSIQVRPNGINSEYPPKITSGNPGGFTLNLNLGDLGVMNVTVKTEMVLLTGGPFYTRWSGCMVGSLNGGREITGGVALLEQFNLVQ